MVKTIDSDSELENPKINVEEFVDETPVVRPTNSPELDKNASTEKMDLRLRNIEKKLNYLIQKQTTCSPPIHPTCIGQCENCQGFWGKEYLVWKNTLSQEISLNTKNPMEDNPPTGPPTGVRTRAEQIKTSSSPNKPIKKGKDQEKTKLGKSGTRKGKPIVGRTANPSSPMTARALGARVNPPSGNPIATPETPPKGGCQVQTLD